jgi:hypothetical protein
MFISVKEAMELTGMSSTTIYRLCNKRINTLYVRREDNKFLIDKEFILATYPQDVVKAIEQPVPMTENRIVQPVTEMEQIENPVNTPAGIIHVDSIETSNTVVKLEAPEVPVKEEIINEAKIPEPEEILTSETISQNTGQAIVIEEEKVLAESEIPVQTKPKPIKTFNWETLIGISVSILVTGILIYLIYLDIK